VVVVVLPDSLAVCEETPLLVDAAAGGVHQVEDWFPGLERSLLHPEELLDPFSAIDPALTVKSLAAKNRSLPSKVTAPVSRPSAGSRVSGQPSSISGESSCQPSKLANVPSSKWTPSSPEPEVETVADEQLPLLAQPVPVLSGPPRWMSAISSRRRRSRSVGPRSSSPSSVAPADPTFARQSRGTRRRRGRQRAHRRRRGTPQPSPRRAATAAAMADASSSLAPAATCTFIPHNTAAVVYNVCPLFDPVRLSPVVIAPVY